MAMENDLVRVFKRDVGDYKKIMLYCNSSLSEQEYLNSEYNEEITLSKKQLEKLMEELK